MFTIKRLLHKPSLTQILLVILLLLQVHSFFLKPPTVVNSRTEVYNNGPAGLSAYQLWVQQGNTGTIADYLQSLEPTPAANGQNGKSGTNGTDGDNGSNANPCTTSQDQNKNTIITCPDGTSSVIQAPKDGENGTDAPTIQFLQNTDTCTLQYKMDNDRLWTDLIKDPECFNYAQQSGTGPAT